MNISMLVLYRDVHTWIKVEELRSFRIEWTIVKELRLRKCGEIIH